MRNHKINWVQLVFTSIVPLLLWMVIIFLLSNRQKVAFTDNYPISFSVFKSLHMIEYGILFLLWLRFFHLINFKYQYLPALLLTFLYGLSDEYHQSFILGREGKLLDACVDGFGGIVAWYLIIKNKAIRKFVLKTQ